MTQSFPTNFHTFHTRKVLTPSERPEDWREVTAAERAQLEEQDAAWVRPPQGLIDMWCSAWTGNTGAYGDARGCSYNKGTGYFEIDYGTGVTIRDLTADDVTLILRFGTWDARVNIIRGTSSARTTCPQVRATLPTVPGYFETYPLFGWIPDSVEVIKYFMMPPENPTADSILATSDLQISAGSRSNLVHILDKIKPGKYPFYLANPSNLGSSIYDMPKLESLYFYGITGDVNVYNAPKIALKCFRYWVERAVNTVPITITVHEEVYSKLTDREGHPDWWQLKEDAAAKQISFAVM